MHSPKATLLLVDDDQNIRELFELIMSDEFQLLYAQDGREALQIVTETMVDAVLLDLKLPDTNGLELLKKIKKSNRDIEVIIVTGYGSLETAVESMRLGAFDYITKPINMNELRPVLGRLLEHQQLRREVLYLKSIIRDLEGQEQVVTQSVRMEQIYKMIPKIASSDVNVYISGEGGTGKALTAKMIHRESNRNTHPFIILDCAAYDAYEIERELFGYGPPQTSGIEPPKSHLDLTEGIKVGRLELANKGTLFLDEVALLPQSVQEKLLWAINQQSIFRIGDTREIKINCRIITSSKFDLSRRINRGLFLKELYYRLNDIPITIPPLCERREDIPILIKCFLDYFNRELKKHIVDVEKETLDTLISYNWPGNIRELRNVIERMVNLEQEDIITSKYLPLEIIISQEVVGSEIQKGGFNYMELVDNFRKIVITKALSQTGGNQTKASEILGVHRNTVVGIVRKYKLATKGPERD